MRAINLSLAHKVYRVDINSITKVQIDTLTLYDSKKTMMISFFDDRKRYVIRVGANNVKNIYYFNYNEAKAAQQRLKEKTARLTKKAFNEQN